jgi:hypothetical protein
MIDPRVSLGQGLVLDAGTSVLGALDRVRPIIRLGDGLDPNAATAAGALYSLLVRLYPHTVLHGDAAMGPNPWRAPALALLPGLLNASRPAPTRSAERDLIIAVGADIDAAELWMGGDEWTVDVGRSPRPARGGRFGMGLQAAAALTAAEVSKLTLGPLGMTHVSFGDEFVWNLLDYQLRPGDPAPVEPLAAVRTVWFGTGSIGSSGAGAAACVGELHGIAHTVDPDVFDPSRNPFRYPATTGSESGPKAEWVAGSLTAAGWDARPLVGTVTDWVQLQFEPGFDGIAVSSVDRVDGRLQVADALSATTLTVGVGGLALHIQREFSFDDRACPYCQYVSVDPPMGQVEVIAQQVGLTPARVALLYLRGDPLNAEDVAGAVATQRIRPERADELIGRRIDDLIRRAYAEATVPQSGGEATAISAPYVSWMGGVFIAAELVKAAMGLPMIDRRFDLDLSGVPLGVVRRRPRDITGNCICASPLRRRWAAKLYGRPWNQTTKSSEPVSTPVVPTGPASTARIGD